VLGLGSCYIRFLQILDCFAARANAEILPAAIQEEQVQAAGHTFIWWQAQARVAAEDLAL